MTSKVSESITSELMNISKLLTKAGDIIYSRFGITTAFSEILKSIADRKNTTTLLSKELNITLVSVAHKTKALENKGLISRELNKSDKRVWFFSMTKRGIKILDKINKIYANASIPLYSKFSKEEQQQLLNSLGSIRRHLGEALGNKKDIVEYINNLNL